MALFFLCAGSTSNLPLSGAPTLQARPSDTYLHAWKHEVSPLSTGTHFFAVRATFV